MRKKNLLYFFIVSIPFLGISQDANKITPEKNDGIISRRGISLGYRF